MLDSEITCIKTYPKDTDVIQGQSPGARRGRNRGGSVMNLYDISAR